MMLRKLVFAIAGAAMFMFASAPANAIDLGYGYIVGTWDQSALGNSATSTDLDNINDLEDLIRDSALGEPFESLGTGTDPFFNQLTLAGKNDVDTSTTIDATVLSFSVDGDQLGGTWTYNGTGNTSSGGGPRPYDDEIVDLYIVAKYGQSFMVTFYDGIDVAANGQYTGTWTIDENDGIPTGLGGNGKVTTGSWATGTAFEQTYTACTATSVQTSYGQCLVNQYGDTGPNAISSLAGFWPANAAIPVPPAVLLLLSGVGALLGFARIRKSADA